MEQQSKFKSCLWTIEPFVRRGLRHLFEPCADMHVAKAEDFPSALRWVASLSSDIILLDWYQSGITRFELIPQPHALIPSARIIVLSSEDDARLGNIAMANGADGYLNKSTARKILPDAIHAVNRGECYMQAA